MRNEEDDENEDDDEDDDNDDEEEDEIRVSMYAFAHMNVVAFGFVC